MATIDERIVSMAFENQIFEQRAAQTMATLGKLNAAIKSMDGAQGLENIEKSANKVTLRGPMGALDKLRSKLGRSGEGAAQGLGDIEKAGNKVTLEGPNRALDKTQAKMDQLSAGSTFSDIEKASNQVELSGITKAIENVSGKFSVLQGAASVALGGIAANAAAKGGSFAKSFAFGPVMDGLNEYKTNLGSIQTILANTEGQNVSGLTEVNKHLDELNTYSDQTIYNFSEMAKNIGTFTAAGVDMDKSTSSIKGIANLAAISGSNSQQASTAMYQLSQAISSGKVGLQDWNSVVNAGMGGAVFQKALMRTAENMGSVEKGAVKIDKATGKATVNGESFRNSIMAKPGQESWLTSDVLVNTLGQLTGDMTDAELAAQGFTAEQIKAIQQQAKTAKAAATEVKTLPQVFDVARETIGSGWAKTFQFIFGDFEESKKTFTQMSNFINGFINRVSDSRNKMLADWKALGGRDELIAGLKQGFQNLLAIIKPIGDAFRAIFPKSSGDNLEAMTARFARFMDALKPSQALIDHIRRIFAGLFALWHIGYSIVGGLAGVILDLFSTAGKGSGGFLELIADVGDWLHAVDKALTQGGLLTTFFGGLKAVLRAPLDMITKLSDAIMDLFHGGDTKSGLQEQAGRMIIGLTPMQKLIIKVKNAWDKLVDGFNAAKDALEPWFSMFVDKLSSLGKLIGDALSKISLDDVLKGVQTGLFAALVLMIKDMFGKGGGLLDQVSKTLGGVQELLEGVTGNLTNMQKKVQAQLILAIAAAVIALAGGVYILSTIDGDKLAKAMTAVAVGLGELMGAMKLMQAGMGKFGALQLPFIAAGIIGLAIAVTIMAGAMKIFATLSWEDIAKGMAGIAGSIAAIGVSVKLLPKSLPITAAGLILVGIAMNIIAAAVKQFAELDMKAIAVGTFGMVESLIALAISVDLFPPTLPLIAAGLIVLGIAMTGIATAVKIFGTMDFATLAKGFLGMGLALAGIAIGMALMPPTMVASAAGLFIVANALVVVGKAIDIMGSLSVATIVKGLITMAGAMIIMAAGLYLMAGTLPGAVALLAAAAALAVLAPVLGLLGNMKWSTIFKGIAAIALVLGTIAVVGLLAAPALAALGIALIPLGLGFMLVAGAAKIFASAMAMLSDTGQKGIAVFLVALTGFVAMIPTIVIGLIKGLLSVVEEMAKIAPKVVAALATILETVIQFVTDNAVKLAVAIGLLVDSILMVLLENVPKLITAGSKMLLALLDGISQNIGQITNKVVEIILKFQEALRNNMPKLIASGALTLRKFLDGVGSKFGEIANSVGNLIAKFAAAVGNQAGKIVTAAATMMGKFVAAVVTYGPTLILKGAQVILDFLRGIGDKGPDLIKKGVEVATKLVSGIADGLVNLAQMGFKAIIRFLNGLEAAIRENSDDLINAGLGVGDAIMDGVAQAFNKGGGVVKKALEAVFRSMPGWAKKVLGIKSPSRVFAVIGENAMGGLIKGVDDSKPKVRRSVEDAGKYSMQGMAKGIKDSQSAVTEAALFAGGIMVSRLRNSLGIHSPSEVFREIGMNVNHGFRDGLLGSKDDVLNAFDSMNSSLIDKIRDLRGQVKDGHGRLEDLQQQHADKLADIAKLRKEKKPDQSAIADAVKESQELEKQINEETAAVNQNGKALTRAREIRASLTGSMKDEKAQLLVLKAQYEDVTKQLETATSELESITKAREDAQQRLTDQYNTKPDIDNLVSNALADAELSAQERMEKQRKDAEEADKKRKINQVELYKKALQEQIIATAKYQATLQKLRELGLDDETYNKLLAKGLSGQDFADQLLKSGKRGVDEINKMDAELLAKSTNLAKQAADNLYNAGIAAAQGLVDGLAKKKGELEAAMNSLADVMVNAIKSKLKIKSPSRIFAEVGEFTIQGLAEGLKDTREVEGAVVSLGRTMTDALASVVSDNMDASPVITPVLDIAQLKKDAQAIPDLSNVIPITAATSYTQASATSQEVSASQQAVLEAAATATPSVTFEQNNYSPEALSDVEIYRKTKNQIGQLKSALGVPA